REGSSHSSGRSGQLGNTRYVTQGVVSKVGPAPERICLTLDLVIAGLSLIGDRLLLGLTYRIRVGDDGAAGVEGDTPNVAARICNVSLRDLAAAVQSVSKLVERTVGLRLFSDPAIRIVGVGEIEDALGIGDLGHPV